MKVSTTRLLICVNQYSILRDIGTLVPENTGPTEVFIAWLMFFHSLMDPNGKSKVPVCILWLLERIETKDVFGELAFLSFVYVFYPLSFHLSHSFRKPKVLWMARLSAAFTSLFLKL